MEGSLFCGQCGTPVQNKDQSAQGQEQPVQTQEQPMLDQTPPVLDQTPPVLDQTPPVLDQTPPVLNQTPPMQNNSQPMQYQNATSTLGGVASVTGNHKKTGIIIGIAVAAVAVVVAIVFVVVALFGGRSYEETVNRYMKAFINLDIEGYIELMPDQTVSMLMEENAYDSDERDEFIEDGQKNMDQTAEELWGEDWEWKLSSLVRDYKYEIEDTDDISGADLDKIQRNYRKMDIDVSEAMNVKVKWTVEGSDYENTHNVYLIKIGNSWYLDYNKLNIGIYW